MTVFILLVAVLVMALLMGVSPASQKVKVWAMYVGAALILFTGKIKMFSEDEQKAILASAYAFAEHNLTLPFQ